MEQGPSAPSATTRVALAALANGVCEFEECGAPLQVEGTIVGEIAHIHSPRPDGPRYDPNLSAQELRSLSNLMFLCGTHHPLIDKNPSQYTAEHLRAMKAKHEAGNYLVTAGVLQQFLDALDRRVPDNWWDRPGAPVFAMGFASNKRAEGNWTFEAAPKQIDGSDIGMLRYRWVLGNGDPPFEPPDHLIRARHWQLKALDFSPKGDPVRLELSFWWDGAERRHIHAWKRESDFQSANVEKTCF